MGFTRYLECTEGYEQILKLRSKELSSEIYLIEEENSSKGITNFMR